MSVEVIHGDCLEVLKSFPDNHFDSSVSDPPSGIGFMGADWDLDKGGMDEWCDWLEDVMAETLRVLKPGAYAFVWALPRTSHWTALALERSGFWVIDSVQHLFGTGFPKSKNASLAIDDHDFRQWLHAHPDELELHRKTRKRCKELKQSKTEWRNGRDSRASYARRLRKRVDRMQRARAGLLRAVVRSYTAGGNAGTPIDEKGGTYVTGAPNSDAVELHETRGATERSQQWDGFGTGLKPAHEKWFLVRKPVPYHEEITECLSLLAANCARLTSELSPAAQLQPSSAQCPAEKRHSTRAGSLGATDTSRSVSQATTSSNIVSSWQDTWGEICSAASMFTTETASSLTIELKTLSCLLSRITHDDIVEAVTQESGSRSRVQAAGLAFSALASKLNAALLLSAAENASKEAHSLPRSPNEIAPESSATGTEGSQHECWWLVQKPFKGTIANNLLTHGVGAMNLDGCRVATDWAERPESWRRSGNSAKPDADKIAAPPGEGINCHPKGRFPANVLLSHNHDCRDGWCTEGCPVRVLGEQSGVSTIPSDPGRFSKTSGGSFSEEYGNQKASSPSDSGTAARYFQQFRQDPGFYYCPKPSTAERDAGLDGFRSLTGGEATKRIDGDAGVENPRAGAGRNGNRRNMHPTVKSEALLRYLMRLITPPGGHCLDMFAGSGSGGVAAVKEGFSWTGIELNDSEKEPYVSIARARIKSAQDSDEGRQTTIFDLLKEPA